MNNSTYVKVGGNFYLFSGAPQYVASKFKAYDNIEELQRYYESHANKVPSPGLDEDISYIDICKDGSVGYNTPTKYLIVFGDRNFLKPNDEFFNLKKEGEKKMREPNSTTFYITGVYVTVDEKPSVVVPQCRNAGNDHILSSLVGLYSSRVKLSTVKPECYFEFLNGRVYHNGAFIMYSYGALSSAIEALFEKFQYIDKIVRFKYAGGTHPGEKRIVKVTGETNSSLSGTDVHKGEERNYLKSKIVGDIEIL